jgi:coproporphyrinogen III oxidase-like Fe-S oxidoreductase
MQSAMCGLPDQTENSMASDLTWLDPIIAQQAAHYGLTVERFTGLMSDAAEAQERHEQEPADTEFWEAWMDGATAEERVTFEVAAGSQRNIVDVAAAVLGVEVSEALNVRRA